MVVLCSTKGAAASQISVAKNYRAIGMPQPGPTGPQHRWCVVRGRHSQARRRL